MKKCPYCSEEIQDEAKKCRFCGEFLKENEKKGESIIQNNKYGSFIDFLIGKGRIGRLKFFLNIIIFTIIFLITISIILGVFFGFNYENIPAVPFQLFFIYIITIFIIKRLHDINKSGLYIVPIYILLIFGAIFITYGYIHNYEILSYIGIGFSIGCIIYSLVLFGFLFFKKGTKGPNRFGE